MKWSTIFAAFSLCADCLCSAEPNLTHNLQSAQKLLQDGFKPPQVFRNVNLVRNTNLEKGFVREQINVVIENVDTTPQSEYYLPFDYDTVGKVGGFEAREKQAAESEILNTYLAATSSPLSEEGARIAYASFDTEVPALTSFQVDSVLYHRASRTSSVESPDYFDSLISYIVLAYASSSFNTARRKAIPNIFLFRLLAISIPNCPAKDEAQTTHHRRPGLYPDNWSEELIRS